MDVLIVLSSHDRLGAAGRKTGVWLDAFAAPYYVFKETGADLTLASPRGGQPPIDPASDRPHAQTAAVIRFKQDVDARTLLADTLRLDQVDPTDFDAAFYPGGYGTLWDLVDDQHSIALLSAFGAARMPVALVGHGPAALLRIVDGNRWPLVAGKQVTAFANSEETAAGLTDVVPFLLEDELARLGGAYRKGPDLGSYVVSDGILITGQNPASSADAARALLAALRQS